MEGARTPTALRDEGGLWTRRSAASERCAVGYEENVEAVLRRGLSRRGSIPAVRDLVRERDDLRVERSPQGEA